MSSANYLTSADAKKKPCYRDISSDQKCVGDKCMAWRWLTIEKKFGYCGPCGKG